MQPTVRDVFLDFSTQFEGRVSYLYVDVLDKVTVGVGNLVDPLPLALALPFVFKSDPAATASVDDITADWNAVKSDPTLARRGYRACAPLTKLMLTDEAIDDLVLSKAEQNESTLRQTGEFADYDDWPADAQLGLLSMAWALGPAFASGWPAFRAACGAHDWDAAAAACRINETGNPGVVPRNAANRGLFRTAAYLAGQGYDPFSMGYTVTGNRPTVRLGSTGDAVTFLQERLSSLDYLAASSDSFDADTDDAVRAFQADNELTADGVVGAVCWAALGTGVPRQA